MKLVSTSETIFLRNAYSVKRPDEEFSGDTSRRKNRVVCWMELNAPGRRVDDVEFVEAVAGLDVRYLDAIVRAT